MFFQRNVLYYVLLYMFYFQDGKGQNCKEKANVGRKIIFVYWTKIVHVVHTCVYEAIDTSQFCIYWYKYYKM